jgi:DNA-binding response OmpR family regulator
MRPRVVLVEDDRSLQRFVTLALEELDIELLTCTSVDEAVAALQQRPAALIVTDLMMPGRSGFDLLTLLNEQEALRGGARLVVFSAGLSPEVRQRLAPLDVWRLLSKPCSVLELEACVSAGLARTEPPAATSPPPAAAPESEPVADPVALHFGGNIALYQAFRASCLRQFGTDIAAGELACKQGDAAALRRLAHSLKSVLLTLGHPAESALARRLETLAEHADWPAALSEWQALSSTLAGLR